ncbi:MAG: bifunctional methylenetetrahydrofolate dehydrogenase/methenyltetrahydrofolate cyclohydrolase FolD [Clostridia bacterium]|nr:bifunctional methylenetetrahydrofolate dehydrogenase/methenyltetrahydrofolate cyclohydrolase FolD [Clostridia bacterium]
MSKIIDGKAVSAYLRQEIKNEVEKLILDHNVQPGLAVILVGTDPASTVYVRNKHKACEATGIRSVSIELPATVSEDEVLLKIDELNRDDTIHGILVQLPLPKHIDEKKVINAISPAKDVDAFHPENVGRIMTGDYKFLPCTPAGIISLLDYYKVEIEGKSCVIIGRSNIVGKPMAHLLLERNGTVTVAHSRTKDLKATASQADILVVAIGKPELINSEYVKEGAVVIDVGINRKSDGRLVGDVDFESVKDKVSLITPVPGGVGPMTITTLLRNTLMSAKTSLNKA